MTQTQQVHAQLQHAYSNYLSPENEQRRLLALLTKITEECRAGAEERKRGYPRNFYLLPPRLRQEVLRRLLCQE